MDASIFRYTWRYSKRQQIWLLFLVLISLPPYFLSLDLPKNIVNGPIQGEGFEAAGATQRALHIAIGFPDWLFGGGEIVFFEGIQLDRVSMLIYLCGFFLLLVLINGGIKLHISTFKGRTGERMLRRLRYQLVDTLLRFPLSQFRRLRASEVATMVKDEIEPLGGFIGDAFVTPALLISQAATAMFFILMQSYTLGAVAAFIVAIQIVLIPRLRRRLLVLGRQRQLTARQLAGRVGEIVEGISEVRTNDASNWERAEIASRLGRIFFIRFDIYQWKFLVKFINNLLAQITPFIFYLIGGYLAIRGSIDIGQLVAVIAAYKDLPTPLKELIDWDQQRLDVQVKYTQVVDQFSSNALLDPQMQKMVFEDPPHFDADLSAVGVTVRDDSGATLLEPTSITLSRREAVAAVGPVGSGAEYLAETMARLQDPSSGRLLIGDVSLSSMPETTTGRRLAYAGPHTYFPQGTIRDALTYGLRHAPGPVTEQDSKAEMRTAEARAAGNTDADPTVDWTDYSAAGASGPEELIDRLREALRVADFERDVYFLGLRNRLVDTTEEMEASILGARKEFEKRLHDAGADDYVEHFDPERFMENATVIENLVFGLPVPEELDGPIETLPYFTALLHETGVDQRLFEMGHEIAETLLDLFGSLAANNPLLDRMDLMAADEIEPYRAIVRRVRKGEVASVSPEDRQALLKLAYGYVEARHRLGLLDDDLKSEIVKTRAKFREDLPADLEDGIKFIELGEVNSAASIQDNVLFGRIVDTFAEAPNRVRAILQETMNALDLFSVVIEQGLRSPIGSGGKGLSPSQQQKLALARAIVKRPDYLIVNRALTALDARGQETIVTRVLEQAHGENGFGTFWVLSQPALAKMFDRVLTFDSGRLVETEETPEEAPDNPEPESDDQEGDGGERKQLAEADQS